MLTPLSGLVVWPCWPGCSSYSGHEGVLGSLACFFKHVSLTSPAIWNCTASEQSSAKGMLLMCQRVSLTSFLLVHPETAAACKLWRMRDYPQHERWLVGPPFPFTRHNAHSCV